MLLTYEAFCKAAKRSAARTGLALSKAQEDLAADLGFKNFDAARKWLQVERPDEAPAKGRDGTQMPPAPWAPKAADENANASLNANANASDASDRIWPLSQERLHELLIGSAGPGALLSLYAKSTTTKSIAWNGFSASVVYRLVAGLMTRARYSPESLNWIEKGLSLLRAVLFDLAARGVELDAAQLYEATDLAAVERRVIESKNDDGEVRGSAQVLARYLDVLPAYRLSTLLANTDARIDARPRQSEIAVDQHEHRRLLLVHPIEALKVLERPSVMTDMLRAAMNEWDLSSKSLELLPSVVQALENHQHQISTGRPPAIWRSEAEPVQAHALLIGSTGGGRLSADTSGWNGFNPVVTYRLVAGLVLGNRTAPSVAEWTEKALYMLRAVLKDLVALRDRVGFMADDLDAATALKAIEKRCIDSKGPDGRVAGSARGLLQYLEQLPAYRLQVLFPQDCEEPQAQTPARPALSQDPMGREQHLYRRSMLVDAFDALRALERPGAMGDEVIAAIRGLARAPGVGILPQPIMGALLAQQHLI